MSRQQSIYLEGLSHNVPIPAACKVGPFLATSGISGKDPASGRLPAEAGEQARQAFRNLEAILAEAGMGLGDVVKLTVFVADEAYRDAVAEPWLAAYPDRKHRPARHALVMPLRGGALLQLEALAVARTFGESDREA